MKFLNEIDGASKVIQDANNRFVTDSEKSTWNGKQNAITGGASTITSSNLTTNRALISDSGGKVTASSVTSTELGYVSGVTSSIQTQLNGKASTSHSHAISDVSGLQTALDSKSASSHNHTLDGLSNTTITSNTNGEILRWNGSAWVNNTLAEAGIAPSSHTHTRSQITDLGTIASINTNASTVNYLRGDGTWVTPPNTTYSAGNGLSLSGTTFSVAGGNGLVQEISGLAMGTPSTLTTSTTNSVTATSHTHAVTFPVTSVNGKTGAITLTSPDIQDNPDRRFVSITEVISWNNKSEIPLVIGTQTVTTASWTGNLSTISSLYSGLTIRYWLPRTSASNVTLNLTLSGGLTTGAIACYYGGTTRLTTHYPAGSFIMMTYLEGALINGVAYTGWWAQSNYVDGNTTYAEIPDTEIDAGIATTLRTISGRKIGYLKNNIVTLGTVQPTVGWWYEVIG